MTDNICHAIPRISDDYSLLSINLLVLYSLPGRTSACLPLDPFLLADILALSRRPPLYLSGSLAACQGWSGHFFAFLALALCSLLLLKQRLARDTRSQEQHPRPRLVRTSRSTHAPPTPTPTPTHSSPSLLVHPTSFFSSPPPPSIVDGDVLSSSPLASRAFDFFCINASSESVYSTAQKQIFFPFLPYPRKSLIQAPIVSASQLQTVVLHGRPNPYRPNLPSPIQRIQLLALSST